MTINDVLKMEVAEVDGLTDDQIRKLAYGITYFDPYVAEVKVDDHYRKVMATLRQRLTALTAPAPSRARHAPVIIAEDAPFTGAPAKRKTPSGQLWQPCAERGCDNEPVCVNCQFCEHHCTCEFGER